MDVIKVTVPYSGEVKEFRVSPEMFEEKQAWRVVFQDGEEEIIGLDEHDTWQQLDGQNLDADFINELGKAIEAKSSD